MKRNFFKMISILLTVAIVLTVCTCAFSTVLATTINYYVMNGGTGDGSSPESPLATVADAVNAASSLTSNDTAIINIMQKDDYASIINGEHGMTIMGGNMPEHDANIIIQSYGETPVNLCSDSKIQQTNFMLAGSVEFNNINLVLAKNNAHFYCGANNVKFNNNVSIMYASDNNGQVKLNPAGANNKLSISAFANSLTFGETANIVINNNLTNNLYLSALVASRNQTYKKDVNVIIDNEDIATTVTWAVCTTNVKGNFNYILKNAGSITNVAGTGTFKIDGALQIIVNSTANYSGNPLEFTNVTAAGGKWFITNGTGNADIISCTEEAGKYAVSEGYKVLATSSDGTKSKESKDGILDLRELGAGEYAISIVKEAVTKNYYVMNGGTGDGSSPESPLATVADAVNAASSLTSKDTAIINVMQKDDYATITNGAHGMTIMGGDMPNHDAQIIIQSYGSTPLNLCADSTMVASTSAQFRLTGSVEFNNINLVLPTNNTHFYLGGNNVTFGNNVAIMYSSNNNGQVKLNPAGANNKLSISAFANSLTFGETANFVINNNLTNSLYLSALVASRNQTYSKDVNIIIDNEDIATTVTWATCTTNVKGNFNYILKNTGSINNVAGTGALKIDGALQMIVDSTANYSGNPLEFTNVTAAGGKWLLNVQSGDINGIACTNEAGKYAVSEGYKVLATSSDGTKSKESKDGILDLREFGTGTYSLSIRSNKTVEYYVSAIGNGSDENTGEENAPFLTVKKAVEKAVAKNYNTGDIVTVKIISDSNNIVSWGGSMPKHAFKLVLESAGESQATVTTGSGTNIYLGGDTDFKNLVLSGSGGIKFGGYNVNFDENTKLSAWYNHIGGNNTTATSEQAVNMNGSFTGYTLNFANITGGNNYIAPVNITINNYACSNVTYGSFNFGSNDATTTQYNSLVNFKLNKANHIAFGKTSKASYTFGQNGAFQFINLTGIVYGIDDGELANIDDSKKWILSADTEFKNAISFTDMAGRYSVTDGYKVTATASDNSTIESQYGILDLTEKGAGAYSLTIEKIPQNAVFYVDGDNGINTNNGTKENPVKYIGDAIKLGLNMNLTSADSVKVILLPSENTVEWWTEQRTPEHSFKLTVESYDRNNYVNVNILHATYLGGPTELKYGNYAIDNQYAQIRINNKDFILDKTAHFSCAYYTFGDNSTADKINGQNVVFKNSIKSHYIYLSNNLHSNGKQYTGDLNVTVDNPHAAPIFTLGGQAGPVAYKANVNFIIKQTAGITFAGSQGTGTNTCEGAIQLITNSKSCVDPDGVEYLRTTCNPAKGFYHLINTTNFTDLLDVTETAGKYVVDTEKYSVTAVGDNGTFTAEDGFLVINRAGEYTITATQKVADIDNTIYEKLDNATLNLWENNGEIIIDNEESVATIDFGNKVYNNVKISIINAEKITFSGNPTINGILEIIANNKTEIVGQEIIDSITAANGKWYVTNTSGCKATWGAEDGEILYTANGVELEVVNANISISPKYQNFLLNEGEYTLQLKPQGENKHDNFITYRGTNLANTYAKIKNNQKLNVVYFGGSVTNGSGASDYTITSWRAQVGQWLQNTYSNVEINNINSAIGATGTSFGVYRLGRHVLEEKPDLLFIEFSINDFYDIHKYDDYDYCATKAAMQLETIIRQVRKELPECDIVVLHTIEKVYIENARNGDLFHEAQIHYNVAEHYDIPSINIGGALANAMPDNWEEVWDEYVTDAVHPSDKGYAIYYDVLNEYLTNCLLYTDHDETVTNHSLPAMYSDVLVDGDVRYYDVSRELIEKSVELGGTGFDYIPGTLNRYNDFGRIDSMDGDDSVFVFKFTGTELAIQLGSNTSYLASFMIKVDDGEYQLAVNSGITPRILVSGLTSGEHTIYIKPVSTSTGTAKLGIIGLYSRDETKATRKLLYGDINNDDVFDIRDLVCAEMIKDDSIDFEYNFDMADRNKDGSVNDQDIAILRVDLLINEDSTSTTNATNENPTVYNLKAEDAIYKKKTLAVIADQKSKSV